jgi:UDPglucose 6-dehydrogenase
MNLCVVGLGKLGAPLAAVLASAGHQVVGVDLSPTVVKALAEGRAPFPETGLQELLRTVGARLTATTDLAAAVRASEMTFLIVPTPSEPEGGFSLRHILTAVAGIGDALSEGTHDHVVVITSTVMPGSTDGPIRAALEAHAGRQLGNNLGLCYSPEFIALGSVIRNMTHPDLILIGSSSPAAAETLARVAHSYTPERPPIVKLSPIDAELAKIAVNTFITTKLSFANQLGEICERLPGADAVAITGAIGLDTRIGTRYLRPATAYGGPCFPRDNRALSALARSLGVSPDIPEATDRVNQRQSQRLTEVVLTHLPPGGHVAILGLTYKPDTPVIEESAGIALAKDLADRGVRVITHDPSGTDAARAELGPAVAYASDLGDAIASADVIVITTPWHEYSNVAQIAGGRLIVDCWGQCAQSPGTRARLLNPSTFNAPAGAATPRLLSAGEPT